MQRVKGSSALIEVSFTGGSENCQIRNSEGNTVDSTSDL